MSVIGKLVTWQFRYPLRYSVITRKQNIYAVFTRNISCKHYLPHSTAIKRVPSIFIRKYCYNTANEMGALSPLDSSSFSRPEFAIIKHIDLTYDVDFQKKVLHGTASYNIQVLETIHDVIFDTRDLTIEKLELENGTTLTYKIDEPIPNFGSKLTINLPQPASAEQNCKHTESGITTGITCKQAIKGSTITRKLSMTFDGFSYKPLSGDVEETPCVDFDLEHTSLNYFKLCAMQVNETSESFFRNNILQIKIKFSSAPTATALQWLQANQTAGKQHPYMFSQCQPIHARSILPCQDTPAVKFTYRAEVTAPREFTVLMSAIRGVAERADTATRTLFDQPVPIPAYLLAIAVGALENRQLGPRSRVWSEKEEIEKSAWEFAETEKYLQAAEQLCGPYQWTQYDLLVLPPSFPYGGMENPCLTFVTPTLLAGDRSQADVIVHEIMHSWTGNLVTNRNFENFWLNEGFTVYLERKVGASLIQDPVEAKQSRDFQSLLGLQELSETVHEELGDNNSFTSLVINLDGFTPDDAFSRVPYEKGSLFLRYLEDLSGGPAVFDVFMRSYLNKFQRQSIDTNQFKTYLLEYFKDNENMSTIDWDTWLYKPGMPTIIPDYDRTMTNAVKTIVDKINEPNSKLSYSDIQSFSPHQVINLLQTLIEQNPLALERLREVGDKYKINSSKNKEIEFRWLRLCMKRKDETMLNEALAFVNSQGRMKYVRPMYRDLYAWQEVRETAIDNFLKNEPFMMHVTAYMLRKDLHLAE